ncbi:MAG: DsbA family oxidoreductase [Bacteroidia bacterium]|jgi:predicted DsbA family dithiol-disulfide isomerase
MKPKKMNVEIWSDVTCTHCYTAKRKFEQALNRFKDKDKITITWRSFELAPGFKTNPDSRLPDFLAKLQGISIEQSMHMVNQLTQSVKEIGLEYHLEKTIPANSFHAHRLSHLAKDNQLQEHAEERLFRAYFTEGKNIDDFPTLIELGSEIELDAIEVRSMLESNRYETEVQHDLEAAAKAGIRSIPHFVFNGQIHSSGAQENQVYLDLLERSFAQWQSENPPTPEENVAGLSCKIGEICD